MSGWIYKKLPPNAGQLLQLCTFRRRTKGLLLAAMIPARNKLYPSLNNATCRLQSCLLDEYILLLLAWGTPLDLKGQDKILSDFH